MNYNYSKQAHKLLHKYNYEYLRILRTTLNNSFNKKYLVFNGGGIKGICFLGVLQCLIDMNLISNFEIYIGTSISSIILFLFLLGYTPIELLYFVLNYNFNNITKFNIDDLFIKYGLIDNSIINDILEKFIKSKNMNISITFKELYSKTNKLYIITGTNLTKKKCEYFSALTTPNMKIIDAIKISSCIPFYFQPYKYNNCYYIDGSCTNDLAINSLYIDVIYKHIISTSDPTHIKNNTLSIYLDDIHNKYDNILDYAFNILYVMEQYNINFNDITLIIDTGNIKAFDFNINKCTKYKLFNIGYKSIYDIIFKSND